MKILQLFKDCFNKLPDTPDIYLFLLNEAEEDYKKFFNHFIQYVGGKSYNEFLDYSLLIVKLIKICNKYSNEIYKIKNNDIYKFILNRLIDDRHDLWQNLLYILDDLKSIKDIDKEFAIALIESFNSKGTGDIIFNINLLKIEK